LYVIDQHAAHERILYEEFVLAFALDSRETSLLAVPVRIDVGDLHTELLLNNIARLADFGFVLEHFGGSSFVIRGVPLWYVRGSESDNRRKSQVYDNDIAGFFLEVFDMLLEGADDDVLDIARLNQLELFTKACKSAIKANEHLNGQEISWLLYNLAECEKPQTCPHGRPTFFKMTDAEIRKRFMRS
jgi:DNA mismatch repair protein MutL